VERAEEALLAAKILSNSSSGGSGGGGIVVVRFAIDDHNPYYPLLLPDGNNYRTEVNTTPCW